MKPTDNKTVIEPDGTIWFNNSFIQTYVLQLLS
jgi:hypothetical protein